MPFTRLFVRITERNGDYMRITPLFDAMQFTASGPNSLWIMGVGRLLLAESRSPGSPAESQLLRYLPLRIEISEAIANPTTTLKTSSKISNCQIRYICILDKAHPD